VGTRGAMCKGVFQSIGMRKGGGLCWGEGVGESESVDLLSFVLLQNLWIRAAISMLNGCAGEIT
jgi:hypothetical protein